MAEQISQDPALILVSGILLFIAGLAIVRIHNFWTSGWPVARNDNWLARRPWWSCTNPFPNPARRTGGRAWAERGLIATATVVLLVLGVFLSFKAYSHD
jgi:hypothetical protein